MSNRKNFEHNNALNFRRKTPEGFVVLTVTSKHYKGTKHTHFIEGVNPHARLANFGKNREQLRTLAQSYKGMLKEAIEKLKISEPEIAECLKQIYDADGVAAPSSCLG